MSGFRFFPGRRRRIFVLACELHWRRIGGGGVGYEAAFDLLGSDGARDREGKGKRQRARAR